MYTQKRTQSVHVTETDYLPTQQHLYLGYLTRKSTKCPLPQCWDSQASWPKKIAQNIFGVGQSIHVVSLHSILHYPHRMVRWMLTYTPRIRNTAPSTWYPESELIKAQLLYTCAGNLHANSLRYKSVKFTSTTSLKFTFNKCTWTRIPVISIGLQKCTLGMTEKKLVPSRLLTWDMNALDKSTASMTSAAIRFPKRSKSSKRSLQTQKKWTIKRKSRSSQALIWTKVKKNNTQTCIKFECCCYHFSLKNQTLDCVIRACYAKSTFRKSYQSQRYFFFGGGGGGGQDNTNTGQFINMQLDNWKVYQFSNVLSNEVTHVQKPVVLSRW